MRDADGARTTNEKKRMKQYIGDDIARLGIVKDSVHPCQTEVKKSSFGMEGGGASYWWPWFFLDDGSSSETTIGSR